MITRYDFRIILICNAGLHVRYNDKSMDESSGANIELANRPIYTSNNI